ncbi:hypothetical protein ENUP19_0078G0011 [Entamoeba nuttalli]|uniref:Uncharacterized protein n=2 Tax=Entamoeba nuttalli TaxID=412467 RepID=K2H727_ENTNP|nr:hypothetical protein ENU1_170260 [Entamoeba nuttalli P19]EKE38314.1 hypothetical protein ENU1_170260 [Entamoeba nuttalli P19]|eukprot:XP_008859352.1 hypothetical protein ENU1_170260 [Entamoeba nuttalli P19]
MQTEYLIFNSVSTYNRIKQSFYDKIHIKQHFLDSQKNKNITCNSTIEPSDNEESETLSKPMSIEQNDHDSIDDVLAIMLGGCHDLASSPHD